MLDRLPWGRFHSIALLALGITWLPDGLEVTLAGAVSGALKTSPTLQLSDAEVGASASAYLAGAVLGAFFFGWLTDRLGRKRLFFITLGVYVAATAATALAQDFATFALFRFLTGAGIGGEYTAINSALQELIPVRYRGRTDLAINGSFRLGALAGALGTTLLLEPGRFAPDLGSRRVGSRRRDVRDIRCRASERHGRQSRRGHRLQGRARQVQHAARQRSGALHR